MLSVVSMQPLSFSVREEATSHQHLTSEQQADTTDW